MSLSNLRTTLWESLRAATTHCRVTGHGTQVTVLACPCVLSGERPPSDAGMKGVFCKEHLEGFAARDPAADDNLEAVCFACLRARGLL